MAVVHILVAEEYLGYPLIFLLILVLSEQCDVTLPYNFVQQRVADCTQDAVF